MANSISEFLKLILQIANLVIICYGGYKFLHKPHDTLESEVKQIKEKQVQQDLQIKDIQRSLDNSHEKHRDQKQMNTVFVNCMLAFIDFEMAYCQHTGYEYSEDLEKAKTSLQNYLAGK